MKPEAEPKPEAGLEVDETLQDPDEEILAKFFPFEQIKVFRQVKSTIKEKTDVAIAAFRAGNVDEFNAFTSRLGNLADQIKTKFPDHAKYALWHAFSGSSLIADAEIIAFDFPGKDSILEVIKQL